jgi:hypothetical protein
MIIGDRIRAMREEKKLSLGDIEKRTVCSVATFPVLKMATPFRLSKLFYEGEEPPKLPNLPKRKSSNDIAWGSVGKEARYLNKLRRLLSKSDETDRKLLLQMAQKMALRHPRAS